MNYEPSKRQQPPGDDDHHVERIEVEFAIPVFLTIGQQSRLADLIEEIARSPKNTPVNGVHWQSGCGSKPSWSRTDAALLGKTPAPDAPDTGEPSFDDDVLFFETSAREAHPSELRLEANPTKVANDTTEKISANPTEDIIRTSAVFKLLEWKADLYQMMLAAAIFSSALKPWINLLVFVVSTLLWLSFNPKPKHQQTNKS